MLDLETILERGGSRRRSVSPEASLDCNDLSDRIRAGGMHRERRAPS
jgi:hypothetical protein